LNALLEGNVRSAWLREGHSKMPKSSKRLKSELKDRFNMRPLDLIVAK
jgi:hypothetical protein